MPEIVVSQPLSAPDEPLEEPLEDPLEEPLEDPLVDPLLLPLEEPLDEPDELPDEPLDVASAPLDVDAPSDALLASCPDEDEPKPPSAPHPSHAP